MDSVSDSDFIYHEFYEGIDHPDYCPCCCEVVSGPAYVLDGTPPCAFHKLCGELPDELQHPVHPQHPLTVVHTKHPFEECSAYTNGFICDGCRYYSWGVRYYCEMCDLNFDARCVSKHESDQQLTLKEKIEITTPFHQHKLQRFCYNMLLSTRVLNYNTFLQTRFFEDIVCCCCLKGFQGSAYACLMCEIFIHESCIDRIPQQVNTPFHLEHPLLLCQPYKDDRSNENCHCLVCLEEVHGLMLSCEQCVCNFHISCCHHTTSGLRLKCHEKHPMLYVYWQSLLPTCVVCKTRYGNSSTYSCVVCKVHVHMECIPLPRVVKHKCHPDHALTLSYPTHALSHWCATLKIASYEYRCVVCEKEGDTIHPFYYCDECYDIAHIDCVLSEEDPPLEILEYLVPSLLIIRLKMDRVWESRVIYHEFCEGGNYPLYCQACREVVSGPAYVDHLSLNKECFHKSCAELPGEIRHPLHPQHLLTVSRKRSSAVTDAYCGFICDGCRHYSWGVRYCCHKCDLKFDVRCVSNLESQQLALKERIEIDTSFHEHKLQHFYYDTLLSNVFYEDIICFCCSNGFQGSAYACVKCEIFIHESCIDKVPQQVKSPFHLEHSLLLRQSNEYRSNRCLACVKDVRGVMLSCEQCYSCNFHISCCTYTTSGLKLKYHEKHPMLYVYMVDSIISRRKCVVCNTICKNCDSYSCVVCEVHVHMECIPLPRVVKHECHPYHALSLSNSTHVLKIASNKYRCVVCEEEGDLVNPFYYCEECPDIAHIDCVLSEEDPPSDILEYLVPKSRYESDKDTGKAEKETKDQCSNESEQHSLEAEEESFGTEQEWKSDLEDCSLAEINKIIESIKKKMNKLASKLEVVQEIHGEKLNSCFNTE